MLVCDHKKIPGHFKIKVLFEEEKSLQLFTFLTEQPINQRFFTKYGKYTFLFEYTILYAITTNQLLYLPFLFLRNMKIKEFELHIYPCGLSVVLKTCQLATKSSTKYTKKKNI